MILAKSSKTKINMATVCCLLIRPRYRHKLRYTSIMCVYTVGAYHKLASGVRGADSQVHFEKRTTVYIRVYVCVVEKYTNVWRSRCCIYHYNSVRVLPVFPRSTNWYFTSQNERSVTNLFSILITTINQTNQRYLIRRIQSDARSRANTYNSYRNKMNRENMSLIYC